MNHKKHERHERHEKVGKGLVPRLRFPEFWGEPGWECKELGEIVVSISNGISLTQGTATSGVKVTRIETISESRIDLSKVGYVETDEDISAYKLEVGDILLSNINSVSHIGKSVIIDKDYDIYHGMNLLRIVVDSRLASPRFAFLALNTDETRSSIRARANKAVNQASISQTELRRTLVVVPQLAEQQIIADCLGSLDDLIAAEGRKLAALRNHKKGLIQQLLPREGETRPRLRFPEFRDAGEWRVRPIGEFGEIRMCKRILASQTNDREGVPFYKIGTLGAKPDAYISQELYEEYRRRFSFPKKGEVLITCSGTVGKCVPYDGEDAYYQDSNIVWIANSQREVDNRFLFSVLLNVDWGKLNSTTITRIYLDDLRMLKISFPSAMEEQYRIADCLSSLDALIAAQVKKLDALRTHKRGLMQQLFPSPEADKS